MPEQASPLEQLVAAVNQMLDRLDPDQAISATITFVVKPDKESEFLTNLRRLAAETRRLDGLKIFAIQRGRDITPGAVSHNFLIYEEWHTVRQFRAQWNSQHLGRFQQAVFALINGQPDLRFYDGSDDFSQGESVVGLKPLATGQRRCWNSDGKPIDCEGSGQDGAWRAGVPFPDHRYTDHGDGTVTDERTGLTWLRDANAYGEIPWADALRRVSNLAHGDYGLRDGSDPGDWRVPNINELQSLVDLDSDHGPAFPDDHPFHNLEAANYWSSSTVTAAPALGWYIALAVAPPVFDLKINSMRIWPVKGESKVVARTGQTRCYDEIGRPTECTGTGQDGELQMGVPLPTPRFDDNGDGTITDLLSGLVWLKDANRFASSSWGDAIAACNGLAADDEKLLDGSGTGDWRLPNVHELRSLVDYDYAGPAIAAGHPFDNVRSSLYWSSTTVASAPNQARFVFVGIGPGVWDHKSVRLGVWPVRDGRGVSPARQRVAALIATV